MNIDLNADLGEHPGTSLDEQIMPYLSSCNIACGGHIGDATSVRETVRLATKHGVAIGAHPSYPDREHFGRKIMNLQPQELAESLKEQIQLVREICEEEGALLHHIKPHGALYNHAASDRFISELIHEVLKETTKGIYWMGLDGSISEEVAKQQGFPFIAEGFADRQYESDGSLRSRAKNGAVLSPEEAGDQAVELAKNGRVMADDWLSVQVQSICLHGDTPGAVTLSKEIHDQLVKHGIQIASIQ